MKTKRKKLTPEARSRHDVDGVHVEVEILGPAVDDARAREDFEQQLLIDPDGLDEALMRQAQTFNDVGDRHVLAISRRDEAEDALKRIEAHAQIRVREELDTAGEKYTEATVKAKVLLDKAVRTQQHAVREAEREASLWGVLKESFHQRSHMLGHMAKLHESGYIMKSGVSGRAARGVQARGYDENRRLMAEDRRRSKG